MIRDIGLAGTEGALVHLVAIWGGALLSIAAGLLWVVATKVQVQSVGTSGWGALLGGEVVVPGPKGERLNLARTLYKQSRWNARAATAAAGAAFFSALALLT